jgi:hypothetical protein
VAYAARVSEYSATAQQPKKRIRLPTPVAEVVRLQNGQRRLDRILTNPATNAWTEFLRIRLHQSAWPLSTIAEHPLRNIRPYRTVRARTSLLKPIQSRCATKMFQATKSAFFTLTPSFAPAKNLFQCETSTHSTDLQCHGVEMDATLMIKEDRLKGVDA